MNVNDISQPISAFAVYQKMKSPNPRKRKSKNKKSLQNGSATSESNDGSVKKQKKEQPRETEKIEKKTKKNKKVIASEEVEEEIPKLVPIQISPRNEEDNPEIQAAQLFSWLMAPLSPEIFFSKYWEKEPVHIKRGKPRYNRHVLTSEDLDKILRENNLEYSKNVDVVAYENGVKKTFNQEGRVVPSAVWDYYENGCSVRILNPHTYCHKVHLLIATLQEYFGTMVGTNVYLTPPNSQGFAPHFDDIEAFIIQLEGRKYWKLYQPKKSEILARDSSPNLKHEDIGEPFMELTLEAGDILYFPRGTIHEGSTDVHAHSLHITVSVYQRTAYADLLEALLPKAVKNAAEADVEFRRGLPLNYLKSLGTASGGHDSSRADVTKHLKKLLQKLIDHLDIDYGADQLGKKFIYDSMPPVPSSSETERSNRGDGPYLVDGAVLNPIEIEPDTEIRLLRYYCLRLVEETGSTRLYYNTENAKVYHGEEEKWLELDQEMAEMTRFLQRSYPNYAEVQELPGEDLAKKLQLISDLWECGLIVTERPLATIDDDATYSD